PPTPPVPYTTLFRSLADGLAVAELADRSSVSPLEGETDRPKGGREGGHRRNRTKDAPLPNPPPQGGRQQGEQVGEKKTKLAAAADRKSTRLNSSHVA